MNSTHFEPINSGEFQNKIVLSKADAVVKVANDSSNTSMLNSFLEGIARAYHGKLKFFALNSVTDQGLCITYGIKEPTAVLFFKKGTLVHKASGVTHRTILSTKIHSLFHA
jgi:thioredoxin-like negative regulator of GroEL